MSRYRGELSAINSTDAAFTPNEIFDCLTMNQKLSDVMAAKGGEEVALFHARKARFGVAPQALDLLEVHSNGKDASPVKMILQEVSRKVEPHCPKCGWDIYEPYDGPMYVDDAPQNKLLTGFLEDLKEDITIDVKTTMALEQRVKQLQIDVNKKTMDAKLLKEEKEKKEAVATEKSVTDNRQAVLARDREIERLQTERSLLDKVLTGKVQHTLQHRLTCIGIRMQSEVAIKCAHTVWKWRHRMVENKLKKKIKKLKKGSEEDKELLAVKHGEVEKERRKANDQRIYLNSKMMRSGLLVLISFLKRQTLHHVIAPCLRQWMIRCQLFRLQSGM